MRNNLDNIRQNGPDIDDMIEFDATDVRFRDKLNVYVIKNHIMQNIMDNLNVSSMESLVDGMDVIQQECVNMLNEPELFCG